MSLVTLPEFADYRERYQSLTFQPLRITAVLAPNSPLVAYDPVNLDNLLAWCVVQNATHGAGVPDSDAPYAIPLPVAYLWRSHDDLPLWATSCFVPVTDAVTDTLYWHKRAMTGRFSANKDKPLSIKTVAGRWMERRVPVPVTIAHAWQAECVGDGDEILRLLQSVAFFGKKRATGFGEVREWRVEPSDMPNVLVSDGCLTRPVPIGVIETNLLGGYLPVGSPALVGWTPPQWKPSLFRPGWRVGVRVVGND